MLPNTYEEISDNHTCCIVQKHVKMCVYKRHIKKTAQIKYTLGKYVQQKRVGRELMFLEHGGGRVQGAQAPVGARGQRP